MIQELIEQRAVITIKINYFQGRAQQFELQGNGVLASKASARALEAIGEKLDLENIIGEKLHNTYYRVDDNTIITGESLGEGRYYLVTLTEYVE